MNHGGNVWQGERPDQWLDFSANLRPQGPPDWVRDALNGALGHVQYYPDVRMQAARAAIAAYLGVDASCVLPTSGGMQAIELAARSIPGAAHILDPAFLEYERVCARLGVKVMRAALKAADHVALAQGDALWLCNPNNPLGCVLERERVLSLLARAEHANARLIVDEAFIGYCPKHSVAQEVIRHRHLIVVGSLTKLLGVPGVRLGYLCAHPDAIRDWERTLSPWSLNCFAEAVARELPRHVRSLELDIAQNAARRTAFTTALTELGIGVYPSEANFVLTRFKESVGPIAQALKAQRILVRTCEGFRGLDDGHHLRLAVKTEQENARLIGALKEQL